MQKSPDTIYKWQAMFVVSIGIFMATLDGSIVNISLPTLTKYFNTDISTIEWVIISYLLTISALLLTLGRLSDMYGKKPVFSLGLLIFTIGSMLCGLSATEKQLIAFRAIQGIGAAMIMANGPAIITHVFPHNERGRALGLVGTVVSVGSMTGPVLGGFLIDWKGWQSIFFINIPIGIFGTVYAIRTLRTDEIRKGQEFDIPGAVFMFLSVTSLLLGLTEGQELGWNSHAITGLFVMSAVFLVLFFRAEAKAKQPMVDISLFKNKTYLFSNVSSLLSFIAMFTVIFLMPFYMVEMLHFSTKEVGMALITVPLLMGVVSPVSGWIYDRTRSILPGTFGMALCAAALVSLGNLDRGSNTLEIVFWLGMVGMGMGIFQSPNNSVIMGSVPKDRLGIASSILALVRNIGMVTGTALSGAVFSSTLHSLQASGAAYEMAFIGAFHSAFMVSAAICSAAVLSSLVRGRSDG